MTAAAALAFLLATAAVAAVAVYAAALAVVSLLGVQAGVLAVAAWRHRAPDLTPLGDGSEADDDSDAWPRVTVQVPLFNEPAVAARVVRACLALDYPAGRLDVQILDDATDETPEIVARELAAARARPATPRVAHLRRPARAGFKAGALAHGLATAEGEFVAVFDADFVPAPDTLRRLVPVLARDAGLGCVQARWAHLNADASWLTRAQAMGLDLHFAVEHRGREALGGFFNFNGTAGLWRRACIDDAGGWRADTLAEDLDLSYRAQLRGWRFAVADAVAVPAELPQTLGAWRTQQRRWAKGGAEVLRLVGPALARADLPLSTRALGLAHLGASIAIVATALAALLHAPAWLAGVPPGVAHGGTLGAAGYLVAVAATARRRRADSGGFGRAVARAPLFVAAMTGLAPSLAASVVAGVRGRRTPFERTEKVGDGATRARSGREAADREAAEHGRATRAAGPNGGGGAAMRPAQGMRDMVRDVAMALYLAAGWGLLLRARAFDALPFQTLALAGSAALAVRGLAEARRAAAKETAPPRRRTLAAPAPGADAPADPVGALAAAPPPAASLPGDRPRAGGSARPVSPPRPIPVLSPAGAPLRSECSTSTLP